MERAQLIFSLSFKIAISNERVSWLGVLAAVDLRLEQLIDFGIQLFPEALLDTKLGAVIMMGAGVKINLNDGPLDAGEKVIEGKAGEHQQTLVRKILSAFFELAVGNNVETISGFLSH